LKAVVPRGRETEFLSARDLLNKYWPVRFHLEDCKTYVSNLEAIPYMKQCLKEDFAKAKRLLDHEERLEEEDKQVLPEVRLSSEEAFLDNIPDEKTREFVRKRLQQLQKKLAITDVRQSILNTLGEVEKKTNQIRCQLLYFAGMNQAARSMTHTSTTTSSVDGSATKKQKVVVDERSELFVLAQPSILASPVTANILDIEKVFPNLCMVSDDKETADAQYRLQRVVTCIEEYLEQVTFIPTDETVYKKKIQTGKCQNRGFSNFMEFF